MSDPRIKYDIEAAVTGEADVAALAAQIEKLAGSLDGDLKTSAQQAAASLRDLTAKQTAVDQFVALKTAATDAAGRLQDLQQQAQALGRQLASTESPTRAQQGALEKLRDAVRNAKAEVVAQTAALDNSRAALRTAGIDAEQLASAQIALRQQMQSAAQTARQQVKDFEEAANQGKKTASVWDQLTTAAKAYIGLNVGREFVQQVAAQEANRKALDQLAGSAQGGAAEMEYLRAVSNRLGVNLDDATRAYISLTAATKGSAMEGQNSRAIFEAVVNAMAKLGKSSADTQLALLAVSQMASKGVISMQDLREQLGQALPGAMQAAAKGMGLTVAELDKMVSTGTVTADQLLPRLAEQLNATFGSEPPDTINAAMAQLKNRVVSAIAAMTEAGTVTTVLKGAFAALAGFGAAAADIFNSASEAVGVLGKSIAATLISIQKVLSGDFRGAVQSWKDNMAEAMDSAANNIEKVRKAVGLLPGDAQQAATGTKAALAPAATSAEQLAAAFTKAGGAAGGMGAAAGSAADSIAQKFKLNTLQGVLDLADAFTIAGDKADDMAKNVQAAIAKMDGAELSGFAAHLQTAFATGQIDAQRFADLNNTVVAQSFKALGLDVDQAFGGISQKTGDAINRVDALTAALQGAGQTGPQAARAIGDALAAALNRADTLAGVDAIKARIEQLRSQLGSKLADGLLQQATDQAKKLKDQIDAATPGINSMAEAFKVLGITSDQTLRDTAAKSQEAARAIEQQGGSVREVSAAWQKALQDAIAANGGTSNATIEAQAAVHGLQIAVDASGKAMVVAAGSAQQMGQAVTGAAQSGTQAIDAQTSAIEQNIAAQEKAIQLADRAKAVRDRQQGVDANGFATSDSGQTIVAGSQVNTKLGIINYLKSGGLSEQEAVQIANQFVGSDGQPIWNHPFYGTGNAAEMAPYMNRAGYDQTKTAEQNLNDAITKALEGRYGSAGGSDSAGVKKFGDTAPTPDQTAAGRSVTVNLKLPNGSISSMQVNSQADAQKLIDALKAAGLVGALT